MVVSIDGRRPYPDRAWLQAYTRLRERIVSCELAPGARLSESTVAKELGLSRTPVREALRRLASEQMVAFEPHLGARVPGWSQQDMKEIFALCVELEGYAAGQAAGNAAPEQIIRLEQLAREMEQAAFGSNVQDAVRVTEANDCFHRLIAEASGNRRLAGMIATIIEIPLVVRTFARFDEQAMARSVRQHFDLAQAISQRNADWATAVMRAHIHAGQQAMLEQPNQPSLASTESTHTTPD